jgi:hypothetical protein
MRTRVEMFDRSILTDVMDSATVRANFARERLVEAKSQNMRVLGRAPTHTTFVDGVPSEDLEKVRPDGRIIFDFDIGTGVVQWIDQTLEEVSPFKSGKYQRSHAIYADGVEVANVLAAEGAEEVVIMSLVPYARKIEGAGQRPPQSKKAPKGVYQIVALMAARRFGNLASIKFTYMNPIGGASDLAKWAGKNAGPLQGRKKERQMQKNLRQPALLIRFR